MRKIFNDRDLQSGFMEHGVVQVPMLNWFEIQEILTMLPDLKPADGFAPAGANGFDQTYHLTFLDKNIEYKRRTFDLLSKVFSPYVDQFLSGYRILSCNFNVKPPGTGRIAIHQNWPTIPNINDTTVTLWCPLSNVVATNGALQFVRGSHKILPHVEGPISAAYFDKFRQTLIDKYLKPNPMAAGEALIFDDGLIHWSANNDSEFPRFAIQISCIPVDTPPVFFFFDPQHAERFEMVEAEPEFYLSSGIIDLTQRQPHWKSGGFVENRNRLVDEEEFITHLANGPKLREQIYATEENPLKPTFVVSKAPNVWGHIRSVLPKLFSKTSTQSSRTYAGRVRSSIRGGLNRLPLSIDAIQEIPIRDARNPLEIQTPEDVKRYYEEKTGAYLEGFGEVFQGSRPASTSELLDYIIEAAELTDGLRILDAGCGVCGPSIYFAQKRQLAIEAVTISPTQVRQAQKRIDALHLNKRIVVRERDFHRLAKIYEPNSFDRVLFLETICHARDYRTVIEQAMHILKPGGLLYIKDFYCQDFRSKPNLIETQLEDLRALNRVYCLVLPDLVSLLELVSELGLMLEYLRKPGYNAVFEPWMNFDRVAGVAWTPKLPYYELIAAMELCCRKPVPL